MNKPTPETLDLLGTWRLLAIEEWTDGECTNPYLYGMEPNGLIHYLPGNRMAAVIAMDHRPRMSTAFKTASLEELASAARTFTAYAGRFSREGNRVVHHIEVNSYENDVGADYVRFISYDKGNLVFSSPSYGKDDRNCITKAIWRKLTAGD